MIRLSGDVADCESYYEALMVNYEQDVAVVARFQGRYIDRFERREGQWKIARRVVLREWQQEERIAGLKPPSSKAPPLRSRDDLSYRRLEARHFT